MTNATDWFENQLVDIFFRGQNATINAKTLSWSAAPTLYIALFNTTPSDTGGGNECANSGNYARVGVACTTGNWSATQGTTSTANASSGTSGLTCNLNIITFNTPSGTWGTINGFAIVDSGTYGAGNMLYWGALTTAKQVNTTDQAPIFAAGALTVTVDN
jgi:hypothetical protein